MFKEKSKRRLERESVVMADWRADPGDYTDFFLARLSLNVMKHDIVTKLKGG